MFKRKATPPPNLSSVYYVTFTHSQGNGSVEVNMDFKEDITHIEDIRTIEYAISKICGHEEVKVTAYIFLRKTNRNNEQKVFCREGNILQAE